MGLQREFLPLVMCSFEPLSFHPPSLIQIFLNDDGVIAIRLCLLIFYFLHFPNDTGRLSDAINIIIPTRTTCSGDSWRARAPFIWELHVNISGKTMQVDFGGEDRYDGGERMRNFDTVDAYSLQV